jgi:hypothetical protein
VAISTPTVPGFTELEQKTFENIQLKNALITQQGQELQAEYKYFVAKIEQSHPGFTFNGQALVSKVTQTPAAPKK